jgi:hypothetical protein
MFMVGVKEPATILAAILGASLGFVLLQTLGERLNRRRLRLLSFQALMHEFHQKLQHQAFSSIISLEDGAYREFKRMGFLVELEETLQKELVYLYSRIHEKNQFLFFCVSALSSGRPTEDLMFSGGTSREATEPLLDKIKAEIDQKMGELLPRLIDAFNHARDPWPELNRTP